MRHLKTFENHSKGWIIPIDEKDLDASIFEKIPDIRDNVRGDIVIGVWFSGDFDAYLLKLKNGGNELGCSDNGTWYGVEWAWGIFDPNDYNKLADKPIELTLAANKYNL